MANISLGNTVTTGLVFSSDTTGNLVLTSTGGYLNLGAVTGGMVLPTGNTDQRPSTVANGTLRYNTTTSAVEGYVAGAWGSIGGSGGGPTWQNVITSNTTVSVGNAYPVNTTSSAIWVTLPANPNAGNSIIVTDYSRTWSANAVTLNPNGKNIQASNANVVLSTNGQSVNLVYIDDTQGWVVYASGSSIGTYAIDYLIVAGGGGGGCGGPSSNRYGAGGGGAGGYVSGSNATVNPGTAYSITVGAGGAGGNSPTAGSAAQGVNGSNSLITGLGTTAIGGGGGGYDTGPSGSSGNPGGSGGGCGGQGGPGGGGGSATAGQGNAGGGGTATPPGSGGSGGGASAAGGNAAINGGVAPPGGAGSTWSNGITYAGGGGAGLYNSGTAGNGGAGGGGAGGAVGAGGNNGSSNTGGGGGGGSGGGPTAAGGTGGSGVVIVRYTGSQRGSGGTVSNSGGYTYHTFTTSGTYTA